MGEDNWFDLVLMKRDAQSIYLLLRMYTKQVNAAKPKDMYMFISTFSASLAISSIAFVMSCTFSFGLLFFLPDIYLLSMSLVADNPFFLNVGESIFK